MNYLKKIIIISWAAHLILLATLILGVTAGNALAKELTLEQTYLTYQSTKLQ